MVWAILNPRLRRCAPHLGLTKWHLSEVLSHLGLTKWHLSEVLSHLGLIKFNLFKVVHTIDKRNKYEDIKNHNNDTHCSSHNGCCF